MFAYNGVDARWATKRVVLTLQLVKQKEPKLNTISQVPLAHVATRPTRPDFERKAGSD